MQQAPNFAALLRSTTLPADVINLTLAELAVPPQGNTLGQLRAHGGGDTLGEQLAAAVEAGLANNPPGRSAAANAGRAALERSDFAVRRLPLIFALK